MSNVISLAEERQKRKAKALENEISILTTDFGDTVYQISINLDDSAFIHDWDDALLGPEDFPNPRAEKTLFGWSVEFWNPYEEKWWTLPQFYQSKEAALAAANVQQVALDFDFDLQ